MADPAQHSYGPVNASGSVRLHQGDNHYHFHGDSPQDDEYNVLYNSLAFQGMDTRFRNVERAMRDTCTWLRSHQHYLTWKDSCRMEEHGNLLWLRGKPGCGKSTIMKEALGWAQCEWSDETILVYFFNARAAGALERSSLGLYQSLTYQLLSRDMNLKSSFSREFSSKILKRGPTKGWTVEDWMVVELQNFLLGALAAGNLSMLNIFVDALDEGDERDVRNLLEFFKKASDYAKSSGVLLRLCLSSRHYPQIDIDAPLSIVVEKQQGHLRDIETYVDRALPGNNDPLMNLIRTTLLQKSQSVFLWVVLTVSILRPLYTRGRVRDVMRELESIPSGLSDLFYSIAQRSDANQDEFKNLICFVLVAQVGLHPTQLYHAIQMSSRPADLEEITTVKTEIVENYVIECSRGLVEIVEESSGGLIVQFIHETVRQFLLEDYQASASMISSHNFQLDTCHSIMTGSCLQYLLRVCTWEPLDRSDYMSFPFTRYAIEFWYYHLVRLSGKYLKDALDSAEDLLTSHFCAFLRIMRQYFPRIADRLGSPLIYAMHTGIVPFCERFLTPTYINARGGLYETALQYAAAYGKEHFVEILIDAGAEVNARVGPYGSALGAAARFRTFSIMRLLLDAGADVNIGGGEFPTPLLNVMRTGDPREQSVRLLLDAGANPDACHRQYGNALRMAIASEDEVVVKLLLDAGANPNDLERPYESHLNTALYLNNEAMVRSLVSAGADMNLPGSYNTLYVATKERKHSIMRILLDAGADANVVGKNGPQCLEAAVTNVDETATRMLIDAGADLNIFTSSVLSSIAGAGNEKILSMLYNACANVRTNTEAFDNALCDAAHCGHETFVRSLLYIGVPPVSARRGETALFCASYKGHEQVVRVLLLAGFEMYTEEHYEAAIEAATCNGHNAVVDLLRSIEAAIRNGHKAVIDLLRTSMPEPKAKVAYSDKEVTNRIAVTGNGTGVPGHERKKSRFKLLFSPVIKPAR